MAEQLSKTVDIQYSRDGDFYCIPAIVRDGGFWLSVAPYSLPVASEWKLPGIRGMAIMRGRDYARKFERMPLFPGRLEAIAADSALVADWKDASWWTPGLEEAWAECEGLHLAVAQHERNLAAEKKHGKK
jgi:hypothetical protein